MPAFGQHVEDVYPLSPLQQGMLFHTLQDPKSAMFFQQASYILTSCNTTSLIKSFHRIVERHPVLRTSFHWEDLEEAVQVVHHSVELPVLREDWSDLPNEEREERIGRFLDNDRRKAFDLTQAPLMRVAIIKLDETTDQLIWSHHHLLLDGWSLPLILRELFQHYELFRRGSDVLLPQPRPFRDYIAWLRSRDMSRAEAFWKEYLKEAPFPTPLPLDKGPALTDKNNRQIESRLLKLSAAETAAFQAFARKHQLTLNSIIQATWAVVLSRYADCREVVFGSIVSGRPTDLDGVESMVGMFLNNVPVRISVPKTGNLISWLKTIRDKQAELLQYEYAPLANIKRWIGADHHSPLFESVFTFENYPHQQDGKQADHGLKMRMSRPTLVRQNFPLHLEIFPGNQLTLRATCQTNRITGADAATILERIHTLLQQISEEKCGKIEDLSLLNPSEYHRVVTEWNQTSHDYRSNILLHQIFEEQAARTPEAVALIFQSQSLTYREINERANQLAHYLIFRTVRPEEPVGLNVNRSPDLAIGMLAILKAGGAYVPLDPTYPADRLSFIAADSSLRIILTSRSTSQKWAIAEGMTSLCIDEPGLTRPDLGASNPATPINADSLSYILYTSGSTGRPKGVAIPHCVAINRLATEPELLKSDEVLCAKTSPNFVDSIWEYFQAWKNGLATVLPNDQQAQSPAQLIDLLARHDVTRIVLVPSLLQSLLAEASDLAQRLPRLQHWISSGEPLSLGLSQEFRNQLPNAVLTNLYGTSEVWDATQSTSLNAAPDQPLPIGRPMGNVQAYVLDANFKPVPIGIIGELMIGGNGLARGYWQRPGQTAERFVPNPFGPAGSRLYRTGDLARWNPRGELELLGRIDQQVKVRGYRVELSEIESVLNRHQDVEQSCVVLNALQQLVAFFTSPSETPPTPQDLLNHVSHYLPDFMTPSLYHTIDKFPTTPSGKIDRLTLASTIVIPLESPEIDEPPTGETEETLARIWTDIFKIDKVSRHSNFFKLGGHSLLAARVASKIRSILEIEMPLRSVFDHPTLARMASFLDRMRSGDSLADHEIPRLERTRLIPLSFTQERLWTLDQIEPGNAAYTITNPIKLAGNLDIDALQSALNEIVRRHESLRTTFDSQDGVPFQVINSHQNIRLSHVDLEKCDSHQREFEVKRVTRELARQPWNLAQGPLFRHRLLRFNEHEHLLLLSMHHIVSDGWSMAIFASEFESLYRAYGSQRPSPLPEITLQYADYSLWQRQSLQGTKLKDLLTYWKKQLTGAQSLEITTDHPRPRVQKTNAIRTQFTLSTATTARLQELSQCENASLFMTILAMFQLLLARYSRQDDVSVGTPVANREHPEFEKLIGFFANTLVIRTDLSGNPTFRDLLKNVRGVCLEAYDHQAMPFEKLVAELQPQRDLSRQPLFQALFVLQRTSRSSRKLPGLTLGLQSNQLDNANYDLTLLVNETSPELDFSLYFNADLFERTTADRIAHHFHLLIQDAARKPEAHVSALSMMDFDERNQVLNAWAKPRSPFPETLCLHELFELCVDRHPHHIALSSENLRLTYLDLDRRANQVAHLLRSHGVGPEIPVGLFCDRSPVAIIAILGILKAGGVYVPLDPDHPQDRLSYLVNESNARIILTSEGNREKLPSDRTAIVLDPSFASYPREHSTRPTPRIKPNHLAYIIFTSGSTGLPKGVLAPHAGIVNLIHSHLPLFGFTSHSRVLQMIPLSFDASVAEIFRTLCSGSTLCITRKEDSLPGPDLLKLITKEEISIVTLVPSVLATLPLDQQMPLLRTLNVGGEACPPELAARWGAGRRIVNGYGPTETTVGATLAVDWPLGTKPPLGRPLPNVSCYVLDKHLQPLPIGVPGELYIGGIGVTRGYLNRPSLTAERFLPDPFGPEGARIYSTGDLARWLPNGQLDYLGRIDDQVKIRGFRIELGEIESVLGQHPSVAQNAVNVHDDGISKRLIGYLVLREEKPPSTADLRRFLSQQLPDYMVPASFVFLPSLPVTPNGKIDRRRLPPPGNSTTGGDENFIAPRTETEQTLAKIWSGVLRRESIGIEDNFFSIGGDSILCIQIVARAGQAGFRLSPKDLFHHQTIVQLAAFLDSARDASGQSTGATVDVQRDAIENQEMTLSESDLAVLLSQIQNKAQ